LIALAKAIDLPLEGLTFTAGIQAYRVRHSISQHTRRERKKLGAAIGTRVKTQIVSGLTAARAGTRDL